jgi:hypothetical protein
VPNFASVSEVEQSISALDGLKNIENKVLSRFMSSIKVNEGHIAHMEYGEIKSSLSDVQFDNLLNALDIDKEKFIRYSDRTCTHTGKWASCIISVGSYCDTDYCKDW